MDMAENFRRKNVQQAKQEFEGFLERIFSTMLDGYLPNSTWHWIGLSPNDKQRLEPDNWPVLITSLARQAVSLK